MRLMALLVLGMLLFGCSQQGGVTPSGVQNATIGANQSGVSIKNFAFSPAEITVKQGSTVTWTNEDSVSHSIKSSLFESQALAPGATYQHTFDAPGEYAYSCGIHPSMQGKVIVK